MPYGKKCIHSCNINSRYDKTVMQSYSPFRLDMRVIIASHRYFVITDTATRAFERNKTMKPFKIATHEIIYVNPHDFNSLCCHNSQRYLKNQVLTQVTGSNLHQSHMAHQVLCVRICFKQYIDVGPLIDNN